MEYLLKIKKAVERFKNEDSDTLLTLLIDYSKEEANCSCGSYDIPRAEACEINIIAIRQILRERLGCK